MSSLPSIRRLSREDLPGAPSWIEQLLVPLNLFMSSVYDNLNHGLTFPQNIRSSTRELTFSTSATYTTGDFTHLIFASGIPTRVAGVLVLQITEVAAQPDVITGAVTLDWTEDNQGVRVRYVSGLANSKRYTVRLLVI